MHRLMLKRGSKRLRDGTKKLLLLLVFFHVERSKLSLISFFPSFQFYNFKQPSHSFTHLYICCFFRLPCERISRAWQKDEISEELEIKNFPRNIASSDMINATCLLHILWTPLWEKVGVFRINYRFGFFPAAGVVIGLQSKAMQG